ncbi:hypothetical protein BCR39DRAFT_545737 [Naematelia encephala]|uniref:T6SS Phospholipase effector Tle1-like catalytic domain-containing protein n=1 Tax=Naematelia encephala TaxID=71784 RepID=A0A1Y2ARE6_9TREE|nr:hypothetical protein BCR39DRAFT_545737 [Naematelia encephala]
MVDPSTVIPNLKPASADARNIVLLLDGTNCQFSVKSSNVIKMLSVLQADEKQLLYYSSGEATILPSSANTWGSLKRQLAEKVDGEFAWDFETFFCDAYKFLMDYYQTGDKVSMIGFSRGAYTARALAGMIQKVGLLPPGNHNQIKLAYSIYSSPKSAHSHGGPEGQPDQLPTLYRRIFGISRPVCIHFMGVWDTVSSLGFLDLPRLPFATGVKAVSFFRQALALDEHRARFIPEYRRRNSNERIIKIQEASESFENVQEALATLASENATPEEIETAKNYLKTLIDSGHLAAAPAPSTSGDNVPIKLLRKNVECWFMGSHADVGGSNDLNGQDSISNIPFRWMLREAAYCGVRLDACGIALEPSLYKSPPVIKGEMIPKRLLEILKQELEGSLIEQDDEEEVRRLIEEELGPDKVLRLVEEAARYDTAIDDPDNGGPMSSDIERPIVESLTLRWWPLELLILQTRDYAGSRTGKEVDIWRWVKVCRCADLRANLGRGRQIVDGQVVHRSVQKRLRHEHPLGDMHWDPLHTTYGPPKAQLPADWGVGWDNLRLGEGPMVWED